jgi:hypothetical protein
MNPLKSFIQNRQARLNVLFVNVLLLGLAISIVTYLFGIYNIDPNTHYPFTPLKTWIDWFSIDPLGLLLTGVGAAVTGLVMVLTRNGTYAIYAMLIAGLGFIIRPVQQIVLAIPTAISMWLPDSTNPNFTMVNGSPVYGTNPLIVVIDLIFMFAAFWFIISLVIQRDL